jgi:hypothetical protein
MNERPENERPRAALNRLPLLIDLFYGFSIANGLSDALKSTIEKQSISMAIPRSRLFPWAR